MVTKKDRRHSGYVTPSPAIPVKYLVKYDLFLTPFYDEWENYRDGLRDWYGDFKLIKKIGQLKRYSTELHEKRMCMNIKQKKLIERRRAMRSRCIANRNI